MNKKSLGYVILKIIGKIAFFLMLVYIAGLVIDHIFQTGRNSIAEILIPAVLSMYIVYYEPAVLSMYIVYYELKKFWSARKDD